MSAPVNAHDKPLPGRLQGLLNFLLLFRICKVRVGRKHYYFLRPGTSYTMIPSNTYGNGGYAYQGKHLEYRPEATNKQGALVNSIN